VTGPALIVAFLVFAFAGADEVSSRLEAARRAEREKDYAAASREYEAILRLQPGLSLVRQSLAITYHLQNRFEEAVGEFERALAANASLWGSHLFLGMDLYKMNRFEAAVPPLLKAIELNRERTEPEARYWLGVTYYALGKPADSIRELQRAAALKPGDIETMYQLTLAYEAGAASAFEAIEKIDPHAAATYLLQAERFVSESRADLARIEYAKALRLRPDYADYVPAEFRLHTDSSAAIHSHTKQEDVDTLLLRGREYKRLAAKTLDAMVHADSEAYRVRQLRGQAYERRTEFENALEEYSAALRKNPEAAGLRYAVGNVYAKLKRFEDAEKWLREELKRNPHHTLASGALGSVLVEVGRAVEGTPYLERAYQMLPDNNPLRLELGRAYLATDRLEPAITVLKAAAAADLENDRVHYLLANAYRRLGRQPEAQAEMAEYQRLTRERLKRAQDDVRAVSGGVQ
jgi:tetratricopeptide (TPR) repeat protein